MADREAALATIVEALPEIMHRVVSARPLTSGELELTLAQARTLHLIGRREGLTMGELAHSLGISMSTATGLVDRLVQHGLVAREVDPDDRRQVRVRLDAAGHQAAARLHEEKHRQFGEALAALSGQELCQIAQALDLLRQALAPQQGPERTSER